MFRSSTKPDSAPATPLSTMAVVSLMVASTGFLVFVSFPIAIVLAHISLRRISRAAREGSTIRGRGFALATLWLSYGFIVISSIALAILAAISIFIPAP